MQQHHPNYTLLSNCLTPDRLIDAVRKFKPKHLYISLDGDEATYRYMRGVDGYAKVLKVVETLKDEIPISFMFCLSPWNTMADMQHVISLAKNYDIDVRIGIYGTMDFMDTGTDELVEANDEEYLQSIPRDIHSTNENYDFVALYNEWKNKRLKLRCHSIYNQVVIHSNGNVPLCQNLDVVLGNIHEQSLDQILSSTQTIDTQCRYSKECNGCWINYHRKFDIILARNLERMMPKKMVELFLGKYQWCADAKYTYSQYFRNINKLQQ